MMHVHNSHSHHTFNVVSPVPTNHGENSDEYGSRSSSSGSVSRITNMNRRSLGSSMGGRGRGWGSASKTVANNNMSPRYTHDHHTPITSNERCIHSRQQPLSADTHDNDSNHHSHDNQNTISNQEEDHTDKIPVELIFEEIFDLPI